MNKAHIFDMITRTIGKQLPKCVFYDYEEDIGYRVEFYGNFEELCEIPIRLDIAIDNSVLVGHATQQEIRKNCSEYVAEYHAYALHRFENSIPT